MTIRKVIESLQELKPCSYSEQMFKDWLSEIDQKVFIELYKTHWVPEDKLPTGTLVYDEGTDDDQELLIEDPYARGVYVYYLCMMIDLNNMELDKYTNSMTLYNTAMSEYKAAFNRRYMPIQRAQLRF